MALPDGIPDSLVLTWAILLVAVLAILSILIVWAAGPLPPIESYPIPADGGYIVTP